MSAGKLEDKMMSVKKIVAYFEGDKKKLKLPEIYYKIFLDEGKPDDNAEDDDEYYSSTSDGLNHHRQRQEGQLAEVNRNAQ
ncbi:unnamed protein product [Enterobius vermicularis]|uniref:NAC domain-containing protein n=1 Tax=Enterobius vermicularis TaxID=51028 RepID=A0A0N4VBY1_ENTVE|nr:unnamed protein product [Enterobius vermicularis]